MKTAVRLLTIPALALATTALCGCAAKDPMQTDFASLVADPAPEMYGLSERHVDVDGHLAVTNNQNVRMIGDDWGRVWYTDHPSRLSPFPVMYTSGMPR